MFHGSIPAPLRSIIYEHAGTWPGEDIYVGCSVPVFEVRGEISQDIGLVSGQRTGVHHP
ncbi:putative antirestriction adenine methyltransferase [Streptomyces mirabilis]|uniref:putative antirestriction adenine methyltransferase n=1 Tax=Streptomyces mirabilis TaxID=68239 RepID=UPI00367939E5